MQRALRNTVGLLILVAASGVFAQPAPVVLTQIVLTVGHRETVAVPGATSTTKFVGIRSGNPSVATARAYRANQVEVVAVAPGKTNIEFLDSSSGRRFIQSVWVQAANAIGGGGAGYDPTKNQLPQIVMQLGHTQNVEAPGNGSHQLSSVVSSNLSVATARTNTTNTIQIYAKALGDTWVDFTDNATGTTYQVHVWVTGSGGKPPADPPTGEPESPKPTADELAIKAPSYAQSVDPCLVGSWVSESLANQYWTGGAGAAIFIDKMGKVIALYSGMSPLVDVTIGGSKTIQGRTVVYIGTMSNQIYRVSVIRGEAVGKILNPNGTVSTIQIDDGGPAVPSNGPYKCTTDRLTSGKQIFRRAK